MALIAEEIVEEWLNRQGFFTIRGAKVGLYEADILAIKPESAGYDARHYEITVSHNPIGYIGGNTNARRRNEAEMSEGLEQWMRKKFLEPKKAALRVSLCPVDWKFCLVVGKVRHDAERNMLNADTRLSEVIDFNSILTDLARPPALGFTASGAELVQLIHLRDDVS